MLWQPTFPHSVFNHSAFGIARLYHSTLYLLSVWVCVFVCMEQQGCYAVCYATNLKECRWNFHTFPVLNWLKCSSSLKQIRLRFSLPLNVQVHVFRCIVLKNVHSKPSRRKQLVICLFHNDPK